MHTVYSQMILALYTRGYNGNNHNRNVVIHFAGCMAYDQQFQMLFIPLNGSLAATSSGYMLASNGQDINIISSPHANPITLQ